MTKKNKDAFVVAKQSTKAFLSKYFPVTFSNVQAIRSRRFIERQCAADGRTELAKILSTIVKGRVQDGLFAGIILDPSTFPQHMAPKLLGTYEDELHPFLESLRSVPFSEIVNIGCAEGYYAVGSAYIWPSAHVTTFDLDPVARIAVASHARQNGQEDRINVRKRATTKNLAALLDRSITALVISDCEGAELELMDPVNIAALRRCYLLVELHPHIVEDIEEVLLRRFRSSHEVQIVYPELKNADRYQDRPWSELLETELIERAVDEYRGYTPWLVARPLDTSLACGQTLG